MSPSVLGIISKVLSLIDALVKFAVYLHSTDEKMRNFGHIGNLVPEFLMIVEVKSKRFKVQNDP